VYFCNNDIAFDTAWTTGTNTRNLTIAVNGITTRIEVPLAGRSSDLFSPGKGWEDTGVFGVLLAGWNMAASQGADTLVLGNANGNQGVQSYAPDVVGLNVWR
jgi:alpha-galactosidase